MKGSRIHDYVEKATIIGVYLAGLTIIYVCIWSYFHRTPKPQLSVPLKKGNLIASLPKVNYRESERTLLIAVNTKCIYCQESVPFYKRLSEVQGANRPRIIAIFPNDESEAEQFLRHYRLNMEIAAPVDFSALGIPGTPTLVLVDSNGRINDFWVGILTPDQEQQVVKGLNPPATLSRLTAKPMAGFTAN